MKIHDENYFDNCATTKPLKETLAVFSEINDNFYYNASSLSDASISVSTKLTEARTIIKNTLNGLKGDVIFTASGTEADNMALSGAIKNNTSLNIVTSEVEHPAVYNTLQTYKSKGFDVRFAPLNADGSLCVSRLNESIDKNTALVSFMHVNNETGGITDIVKAAEMVKIIAPKALVMCDGVQAFMKVPVNLDASSIDFYTMSAHKIHAPKGVGALWIRNGLKINPIIFGGGQEKGLRSGTENVAGICAFAKAISLYESIEAQAEKYKVFKEILNTKLLSVTDKILLCENGASNIYSVVFGKIKSEIIMHMLENNYGYIVGIGSACSSKHRTNRIANAIKLPSDYSDGLIRISFSHFTTKESVIGLADSLVKCINTLRGI